VAPFERKTNGRPKRKPMADALGLAVFDASHRP
jgi:hypothetical protein